MMQNKIFKIIFLLTGFAFLETSCGIIQPGLNTITEGGKYWINEDTSGYLVIDADKVTIDLQSYTLSDLTTNTIIEIRPGHTNIEIKNGKIRGASDQNNDGIYVWNNNKLIILENLKIDSCKYGLNFQGTADSMVMSCRAQNCEFIECQKGVSLNYTKRMVMQNCQSYNCIYSGFEQNNCQFDVCDNCAALETSNNSSFADSVGFSSYCGRSNLFSGCIAEGTTKTVGSYTTRNTRAVGYLITGTEYLSQIINSVANTSFVNTESCMAYGIYLDPFLKSGTMASLQIASSGPYAWIFQSKWAPDGRYLACGLSVDATASFRVFKFTDNTFYQIASAQPSDDIYGVDWSPDGKYLATSKSGTDPNLKVYSFNGSTITLFTSYSLGAAGRAVHWSPSGKYIAVSQVNDGSSYNIKVLKFDETVPSLTLVARIAAGGTVAETVQWSPCGRYLAVGLVSNASAPIKVYEFNGSSTLNFVASSAYYPTGLAYIAHWSPDGKYLLLGGSAVATAPFEASYAVVFLLDASNSILAQRLLPIAQYQYSSSLDLLDSADWSQDGKYIVLGGNATVVANRVQIVSFDGSSLTQVASKNFNPGGRTRAIGMSKDGKYLAIGYLNLYNFYFMDTPKNCLLYSNKICDSTSYLATGTGVSRQAIGICGIGDTLYAKNVAFQNDIDFNKAVYNVYGTSLLTADPKEYDNIWQSPYYNAYGMN